MVSKTIEFDDVQRSLTVDCIEEKPLIENLALSSGEDSNLLSFKSFGDLKQMDLDSEPVDEKKETLVQQPADKNMLSIW